MRDTRRDEDEIAGLDGPLDAATNTAAAEFAGARTRFRIDQRSTGGNCAGALAHDPDFGDAAVLQRRFSARDVPHVDAEDAAFEHALRDQPLRSDLARDPLEIRGGQIDGVILRRRRRPRRLREAGDRCNQEYSRQ
jgi:hypothetical protein